MACMRQSGTAIQIRVGTTTKLFKELLDCGVPNDPLPSRTGRMIAPPSDRLHLQLEVWRFSVTRSVLVATRSHPGVQTKGVP
jgi:hypothetical protein